MLLPNGKRALVPLKKLVDYCLNADHPRGQHKARVFESALGITADNAAVLTAAILEAAATRDATPMDEDDYGRRFMLDFQMQGIAGQVVVRSLWIVRRGEDFPRLTSCFVR